MSIFRHPVNANRRTPEGNPRSPCYSPGLPVSLLASTNGHHDTDKDGGCHNNPEQVLDDIRPGVSSRDDIGDEGVNNDKGDHADDDGY